MPRNNRRFSAGPDPFGRTWEAEFQWLQTGISIRHADTVDVKFYLWTEGPDKQEEDKQEKVIALPHAALLDLSRESGHSLTDPWCMKIAAAHLGRMIRTFEDMEKTLVTLSPGDLRSALKDGSGALQTA